LITLWYLLFQRLSAKHSLSVAVEDAREGGADRLSPRGQPLSGRLGSEATTSFSDARQRLPLPVLEKALHYLAERIQASLQSHLWFGCQVALLDGSTCRLRPFGDIPQRFPPHRPGNCKKDPYWCVARLVAVFALNSGALLDTALGSLKASEQTLCARMLKRSWQRWLLVADRNFGVYSVVSAAAAAQAHLLVRLTRARAAKLARLAKVNLAEGLDVRITWRPSPHDQCAPQVPAHPIEGRLVMVCVQRPGASRPVTLYLFTTLLDGATCSALDLARLYAQRWQVELFLRYVKTQMDLGFLQCRSADMAAKEWLAGLIAYNLVRWTMAAAAALAQVPIQILSFSRTRELLCKWFLRAAERHPTLTSWRRLLGRVAKARLPKRHKPRPPEPRSIRSFRQDFPTLAGDRAQARKYLATLEANS
jgi:hypothetical protein